MKQASITKLTIQGMLLEIAYWLGFCAFLSFSVSTLVDCGWSASAATAAITAMSVLAMVSQPVYGYLADHRLSEKQLFIFMLAMTATCMLLLPTALNSGKTWFVVLLLVGIAISGYQATSMLDAWLIALKQEHGALNYGLIRGCGSIAFAFAAQVMGGITVRFGHGARLWFGATVVLLGVVAACLSTPASRRRSLPDGTTEERPLAGKEAFRVMFASKQYRLMVAVGFFLMFSANSMLTLLQLMIPEMGGTTAQIGTATAVMAISETPSMFMMAYFLRKFGEKKLLLFTAVFYTVRMIITACVGTISALIVVQALQCATFAVLQPVSMSYLSRVVDARVRTTAVTTYAAIACSLSGILSSLLTSAMLAAGGTTRMVLVVFACSAGVGLACALYGARRKIW